MGLIEKSRVIDGIIANLRGSGAPLAGTDEVQTLTFGGTISGGDFRLEHEGAVTAAISWSSTNNTLRDRVDLALEALETVGAGGVSVAVGSMTSGVGTLTVTFAAQKGKKPVGLVSVAANNLTGTAPTVAVARTTAGVEATGRGSLKGSVYTDVDSGTKYVNSGTTSAPSWT